MEVTFSETRLFMKAAHCEFGVARVDSGVNATQCDGDHWEDRFLTIIDLEVIHLRRNLGGVDFAKASLELRSATPVKGACGPRLRGFVNHADRNALVSASGSSPLFVRSASSTGGNCTGPPFESIPNNPAATSTVISRLA